MAAIRYAQMLGFGLYFTCPQPVSEIAR